MKKRVICLTFLSAMALIAKEISVPQSQHPPVIDGKSSDKCWERAQWNSGFYLLGNEQVKAQVKTRFKFLHDNNYLYLLVEADEPHADKIKANVKSRDGNVFFDDSIELFLNANDDNGTYHQFIFNTLGAIYDSEHTQGGGLSYPQWDSEVKVGTSVAENKWTLEVAIPVVDLNVNSDNWLFNIGRNHATGPKWMNYTFSGPFNELSSFATLNFIDADFSQYNISIAPFYDERTVLRSGEACFRAKTFIQNNTGKMLSIEIDAELSKGGKVGTRKVLSTNTGEEINFEIPVKTEGIQQFLVRVYDYRGGMLLGKQSREVNAKATALETKLLEPGYRNSIYASQKLQKITGNIAVFLDEKELKGSCLTVSLKGLHSKVINVIDTEEVRENNQFSFPIQDIETGRYLLDVQLLKNGKKLHSDSIIINKLPKVPNEYRVDRNGNVLYNGKFFMPYGWFCISEKKFKTESEEGINILLDYGAFYKKRAELKGWLDAAHASSLKVIIYPYPRRSMLNKEECAKPLSDEDATAISEFVNQWKEHPALTAWYLADEPFIKLALPARMKAIYEVVARADPYHPAIILDDTVNGIHKYADYCDILMADPYPLFAEGGYAVRKMSYMRKFSEAIAAHEGKGHWMTPQGFNYGDHGLANNRAPNFDELRCQQYKLLIGGATGIIWWWYPAAEKYPVCLHGIRYLAREAKLLEAVVEQNWNRKVLQTSDDSVTAAWYKNIEGHDYVVAVNSSVSKLNVKIALPINKIWHVMSENRKVQSNRGGIEDVFDIYEAHIYTTNNDIADKLSIREIQQKIKETD